MLTLVIALSGISHAADTQMLAERTPQSVLVAVEDPRDEVDNLFIVDIDLKDKPRDVPQSSSWTLKLQPWKADVKGAEIGIDELDSDALMVVDLSNVAPQALYGIDHTRPVSIQESDHVQVENLECKYERTGPLSASKVSVIEESGGRVWWFADGPYLVHSMTCWGAGTAWTVYP